MALCSVEWPVDYEVAGLRDCSENPAPFECMAVDYLWNWTAKRYGLTLLDVRPCLQDCASVTYHDGPGDRRGRTGRTLLLFSGERGILSTYCARCRSATCSCSLLTSLALPSPVAEVLRVEIAGEALDPAAYTVYDDRYLTRIDGGAWPRCQDFEAPLGDPGTWRVVLKQGVPVPSGGRIAAAVLSCELAKAAAGSSSCRLPQRLQSITRQGVTMAVLDPFEGLDNGRTGIWLIDSWIASVTQAPRGGSVRSVDIDPSTRRRRR